MNTDRKNKLVVAQTFQSVPHYETFAKQKKI